MVPSDDPTVATVKVPVRRVSVNQLIAEEKLAAQAATPGPRLTSGWTLDREFLQYTDDTVGEQVRAPVQGVGEDADRQFLIG